MLLLAARLEAAGLDQRKLPGHLLPERLLEGARLAYGPSEDLVLPDPPEDAAARRALGSEPSDSPPPLAPPSMISSRTWPGACTAWPAQRGPQFSGQRFRSSVLATSRSRMSQWPRVAGNSLVQQGPAPRFSLAQLVEGEDVQAFDHRLGRDQRGGGAIQQPLRAVATGRAHAQEELLVAGQEPG